MPRYTLPLNEFTSKRVPVAMKYMSAERKEKLAVQRAQATELQKELFEYFCGLFCAAEIRGTPNIEKTCENGVLEGALLREDEVGPEYFSVSVTDVSNVFSVVPCIHVNFNVDTIDFPSLWGRVYLRIVLLSECDGEIDVYLRGRAKPAKVKFSNGLMQEVDKLFDKVDI